MNPRFPRSLGPLAVLLLLWGCASFHAPFDQKALDQAMGVKQSALALMSKAGESYALHEGAANLLKADVDAALLYASSREKNKTVVKQWEILKDPSANSLGGFLARWKEEGTLNAAFAEEARGLVEEGLDTIIQVEEKRKQ